MQDNCSKRVVLTDRQSTTPKALISDVGILNSLPRLDCRIRQTDGSFTTFNILEMALHIEQSMFILEYDLDQPDQQLVCDLCSKVIHALTAEIPSTGVITIEDLRLQVEMTLILNQQADLSRAYVRVITAA